MEGEAYGMDSIRLTELQSEVDEDTNDIRVRRADDVLAAYEREAALAEGSCPCVGLPDGEPFLLAKFAVKFRDSGRERVVTVNPPNRAKYTQDRDGLCVTEWLRGAGFVLPRQHAQGIADEQ